MLTDKELAEIRERAGKRIAGKYTVKSFGIGTHIYLGPVKIKGCGMSHNGEICQMADPDCEDFSRKQLTDTMKFFAHSGQDVPALLNMINEMKCCGNCEFRDELLLDEVLDGEECRCGLDAAGNLNLDGWKMKGVANHVR